MGYYTSLHLFQIKFNVNINPFLLPSIRAIKREPCPPSPDDDDDDDDDVIVLSDNDSCSPPMNGLNHFKEVDTVLLMVSERAIPPSHNVPHTSLFLWFSDPRSALITSPGPGPLYTKLL
jgi:hypothetical protein